MHIPKEICASFQPKLRTIYLWLQIDKEKVENRISLTLFGSLEPVDQAKKQDRQFTLSPCLAK